MPWGRAKSADDSAGLVHDKVEWIAGGAICIAAALFATLYYTTRVCNQQIGPAGEIVTLCRSLEATDPPMIGLGIVVLVALTAFFTEISGFGISLKRDVQQAKEDATNAKAIARSANQNSEVAQTASLRSPRNRIGTAGPPIRAQIDQLVDEYNRIRTEQRSSDARTTRLSTVVSTMISILNKAPSDALDPLVYLESDDGGRRLAGYAQLYAHPNPRLAQALVKAIVDEKAPFGQYWALRALRRVLALDPAALDFASTEQLRKLLSRFAADSDRAFELSAVLATVGG